MIKPCFHMHQKTKTKNEKTTRHSNSVIDLKSTYKRTSSFDIVSCSPI